MERKLHGGGRKGSGTEREGQRQRRVCSHPCQVLRPKASTHSPPHQMAAAKSVTPGRRVVAVSSAASSQGPMTRSQSHAFCEKASAVQMDVFGKEVSASDHVSEIDKLIRRRQTMLEEKRKLQKELKSAQRRRQRLKRKAKELTQEDLVAVLLMREQEDVKKRKAPNVQPGAPEGAPEVQPAPDVTASPVGSDPPDVEPASPSGETANALPSDE